MRFLLFQKIFNMLSKEVCNRIRRKIPSIKFCVSGLMSMTCVFYSCRSCTELVLVWSTKRHLLLWSVRNSDFSGKHIV